MSGRNFQRGAQESDAESGYADDREDIAQMSWTEAMTIYCDEDEIEILQIFEGNGQLDGSVEEFDAKLFPNIKQPRSVARMQKVFANGIQMQLKTWTRQLFP